MSETKMIYKIFRDVEWSSAESAGQFNGSGDDIRDGFIHFSNAEQLRGTLKNFFANEGEVVIASFDPQDFGNALKWEVSRGGMKFPHLYAVLPIAFALQVLRLPRSESGDFILPDEIL
jgi:uncharacterized protein (DUF952 family)